MDNATEKLGEMINKLYSKYPDLDAIDKKWEFGIKEDTEIPVKVLARVFTATSGKQIELPSNIAEYAKAKGYKEMIEDDIKELVDCAKGLSRMSEAEKHFFRESLKNDIVTYICLEIVGV